MEIASVMIGRHAAVGDLVTTMQGDTTFTRPGAAVRHLSLFGAISALFCTASIGALDVVPSGRGLSPISAPISDYALTSAAWLFDTSILLLATGMGAVVAAMVLGGYLSVRSTAFAALLVCCAALVTLVIFPDHNLDGVLGPSGWVHRAAAVIAFGGLPLSYTLLRRGHRSSACRTRLPALARALSLTAGACFLVLLGGSALDLTTSLRIWHVGGIIERVLGLAEMGVTVLMAIWARGGCACTNSRGRNRVLLEHAYSDA